MPQVEKPGLLSYDDAARRSQRQTTGHNARSSGVSPDGLGRAWVVTVATAASTVVFIVLHRVQINVILPFQQEKLGVDWTSLPMISLVHGLRVILAWMFGWYGVLILAPSMIYLTLQINGFAMPPAHHLILMAVLLTSAPFSFSVMEVFGVAARAEQDRQYWWRAILLVFGDQRHRGASVLDLCENRTP